MQKQKRSTRSIPSTGIRVVLDNGMPATISRKNIGKMTTYSGTASDGSEVHSLQATQVGKTTIVRDGQGNVSSFLTNDLEVLAAGLFPNISKAKATPTK